MKTTTKLKIIAWTLFLIGIGTIINGLAYNVSHLDSYLDQPHNFLRDNEVTIGYLMLVIAPIIVRRYIWAGVLIGLAMIFEVWIYFSSL